MVSEAAATSFVTLTKSDARFDSYLDGRFSQTQVAIPVRTLNVRSQKEEVTFELVDAGAIRKPSIFLVLLKLLRPQTLSFSVGAMLVAWIASSKWNVHAEPRLVTLSLLGVLFFHASLNLLNDFYDHKHGHDRLNLHGGSRVIQRGWIRAYKVQRMGFALFALAVVVSIPVILAHASLLFLLAGMSAIAGIEFTTHRFGLKNFGGGEWLVFFLTGPLLTSGFIWAITGQMIWQMAVLGCVFGSLTLLFYHLSNIENMLLDAQARKKTWAVYLGLDRAKSFLWAIAVAIAASYCFFILIYSVSNWTRPLAMQSQEAGQFLVLALMGLILAGHTWAICARSNRMTSPLSSDVKGVRERSLRLHWLAVICLALAL